MQKKAPITFSPNYRRGLDVQTQSIDCYCPDLVMRLLLLILANYTKTLSAFP
jgi:hypothetical protein